MSDAPRTNTVKRMSAAQWIELDSGRIICRVFEQ